MNRSTYIISTILSAVFLISCLTSCNEDNFLEYEPRGRYSVENFYQTEVQIEGAVNGIYPTLKGLYNGAIWQSVEYRSDNTTFIPNPNDRGSVGLEEVDYFAITSSAGIHGTIWGSCYKGISNANYVIHFIDEVPFDRAEDKAAKLAEARFLRAFYYYILTQSFGDVVKVTEIIESEADAGDVLALRRAPRAEVISEIIIPDLEFAIDNLPAVWGAVDNGRATEGAARMLLAKIYFADREYEPALIQLDSIIESGLYALENDYRSVFAPGNQNSPEIIFANQFSVTANQGAGWFLSFLPYQSGVDITQGIFVSTSASKNIPTQDLLESFEEGDRRFSASIGFYDEDENDPDNELIPYCRKYLFTPVTNGGSDLNFPVFRYADALLMKAEAIQEINGGLMDETFELINNLRVRAGLPLYFPGNPNPDLDINSPERLEQAIRDERRVELAFENHRWWDLMRYENLQEVMQAHGEEQKEIQDFLDPFPEAYTNITELLAIPFSQVEQYGYRQNPGWE